MPPKLLNLYQLTYKTYYIHEKVQSQLLFDFLI